MQQLYWPTRSQTGLKTEILELQSGLRAQKTIKPAPSSDNVYAQLLGKYPAPSSERSPMPDPQPTAAVQMTEAMLRAVCSFPAGSAGGPDGVRPQHIL